MGLFSQDCKTCGESVKCPYNLPEAIKWQNRAVAITPNGSIIKGPYDGYGKIEYESEEYRVLTRLDLAFDIGGGNTVYHELCWERAGKPTDYAGPSDDSVDQGYFYEHASTDKDVDDE